MTCREQAELSAMFVDAVRQASRLAHMAIESQGILARITEDAAKQAAKALEGREIESKDQYIKEFNRRFCRTLRRLHAEQYAKHFDEKWHTATYQKLGEKNGWPAGLFSSASRQ